MALSGGGCSSLLCTLNGLSGPRESSGCWARDNEVAEAQSFSILNNRTNSSPTPNQATRTWQQTPLQESKTVQRTSNVTYPFYYFWKHCSTASGVSEHA